MGEMIITTDTREAFASAISMLISRECPTYFSMPNTAREIPANMLETQKNCLSAAILHSSFPVFLLANIDDGDESFDAILSVLCHIFHNVFSSKTSNGLRIFSTENYNIIEIGWNSKIFISGIEKTCPQGRTRYANLLNLLALLKFLWNLEVEEVDLSSNVDIEKGLQILRSIYYPKGST